MLKLTITTAKWNWLQEFKSTRILPMIIKLNWSREILTEA